MGKWSSGNFTLVYDYQMRYPTQMSKTPHHHAAALDRIGRQRVMSHFNIKTAAFSNWKARGVPSYYIKSLATLAAVHGVQAPELYKEMES